MKYKKLLYLIIPTLILVLECLPYGVKLNLVTGSEGSTFKLYSFFDVTLINNNLFIPMFVFIASIILLLLDIIYIVLSIYFPKVDERKTYRALKLMNLIVVVGLFVNILAFFESVGIMMWVVFALSLIDLTLLLKYDQKVVE